jgi:hypothetical protein
MRSIPEQARSSTFARTDNRARLVATLVGIDLLVSVAALAVFFVFGAPFGAINDWTIGIGGVLTLLLVLTLDIPARLGVMMAVGVVGSSIVVVGAALVISRTTGFLLAGLVESFGFGLVGLWLIALYWTRRESPSRINLLGAIAGAVMAVGLIVLPAVVTGVDDAEAAPGYVWLGFVGWIGIFVLYPLWAIWSAQRTLLVK